MRTPNGQEAFLREGGFASENEVGSFRRLLYAVMGLIAGNAAMLVLLGLPVLFNFRGWWDVPLLYAVFSAVGWVLVGCPIVLVFPPLLLLRVHWALRLLIGATLGPIALLLIFFLLYAKQGAPGTFSLDHTGFCWPMSVVVSTVSFHVYVSLLGRRLHKGRQ